MPSESEIYLHFTREHDCEDIVEYCKDHVPLLKHIPDMDIKNGEAENILIEGDNFACLTALSLIYPYGLADIICIDPPYNTGNDDFAFKDGFQSTDWLCMMEKRLKLAKGLLKNHGIIYINIDDNEFNYLKCLCDSIFGSDNYINDFIWINNLKGRQISSGGAVKTFEHILLYAKKADLIPTFEGDIRELSKEMPMIYKNKEYDVLKDEYGQFIIKNELYNTNSAFNEETRPNLVFDIYYNPKSKKIITCDVDEINDYGSCGYVLISPHKNADGVHKYHAWRWSRDKIAHDSSELYFEKDENDIWKVYTKCRDIHATNLKDILSDSTNGNKELAKILGKGEFDYPKPVKLIKRLIKSYEKYYDADTDELISLKEPITILDFFAGSGTTGQAVLELNKEDGKQRVFILNTLNEVSDKALLKYLKSNATLPVNASKSKLNEYKKSEEFLNFQKSKTYESLGVCQRVAHKRLKTILTGVKSDGSHYSSIKLEGTIRYYKVDFVEHYSDSFREQTMYNIAQKADGLICLKENVFEVAEKDEKYNIYLSKTSGKCLAIYHDNDFTGFSKMIDLIKTYKQSTNVIYYFSISESPDSSLESFVQDNLPGAQLLPYSSKMYEIYCRKMKEFSGGDCL